LDLDTCRRSAVRPEESERKRGSSAPLTKKTSDRKDLLLCLFDPSSCRNTGITRTAATCFAGSECRRHDPEPGKPADHRARGPLRSSPGPLSGFQILPSNNLRDLVAGVELPF